MARQTAATLVALVLALVAAVAVNAQEPASAPSPSAVTGAGFSVAVSGGVVLSSLLFSLFSLFRH